MEPEFDFGGGEDGGGESGGGSGESAGESESEAGGVWESGGSWSCSSDCADCSSGSGGCPFLELIQRGA